MWQLVTDDYRADGIFSTLFNDNASFCRTLEHAYEDAEGNWYPKLKRGATYKCVRGMHTLEHYNQGRPFECFEITGVPGHTGILLHVGNLNRDSDGCVLLGNKVVTLNSQQWMVQRSQDTFSKFMSLLDGIDEFDLEVT